MTKELAVPDEAFVVPGLGMVIDRNDPTDCARALADLKALRAQIRRVEDDLAATVVAASEVAGTKTLHYADVTATVKGGTSTEYDPEYIEAGLRRAGMDEGRIREVVKETVTYTVGAQAAKEAAAANPKYARVIKRGSATVEKRKTVEVKPR